jgi:hypothetical protein
VTRRREEGWQDVEAWFKDASGSGIEKMRVLSIAERAAALYDYLKNDVEDNTAAVVLWLFNLHVQTYAGGGYRGHQSPAFEGVYPGGRDTKPLDMEAVAEWDESISLIRRMTELSEDELQARMRSRLRELGV